MKYFTGLASQFKPRDVFRHLFTRGSKRDIMILRSYLLKRYNSASAAFYHTGRTALAKAIYKIFTDKCLSKTEDSKAQASKKADPSRPQVKLPCKVVVTAMTCYAVVEAVRGAGCEPIFADIDPETLHFDAKTLKKCLELHKDEEIIAIIVQNNLGHPCKIAEIEAVAKKHNLPIIEDLAHSAGVRYADGREAGLVGDYVVLSFGKGKSIDTSSGGVLLIKQESPIIFSGFVKPKLVDRLRDRLYPFFGMAIRALSDIGLGKPLIAVLVKTHLIQRSADAELDANHTLMPWQAKLALAQLKEIEQTYPSGRPPVRDFYFVDDRAQTLRELKSAGYHFDDIWYDTPVAPERYYKKSGFVPAECPVATELAKHIVNVPTHYEKSALAPALEIIKRHAYKGVKNAKK